MIERFLPILCLFCLVFSALLWLASRQLLPLYGAYLSNPLLLQPLFLALYLVAAASTLVIPTRFFPSPSTVLCLLSVVLSLSVYSTDFVCRTISNIEHINPANHPYFIHFAFGHPLFALFGILASSYARRTFKKIMYFVFIFSPISLVLLGNKITKLFDTTGLAILPFDDLGFSAPKIAIALSAVFAVLSVSLNLKKWKRAAVVVVFLALSLQSKHMRTSLFVPYNVSDEIVILGKNGSIMAFEDKARHLRVLRAGHSIIGGIFTDTKESCYAVFYFHEMHRIIHDNGAKLRGLMIGFGIGSAATAYVANQHELNVFEIDGNVIDMAKRYFPLIPKNMVSNLKINIADGGKYIRESAISASYDFIIHDIFSGGGVQSELYTFELFTHCKRVLKPSGTISVNFVGSLSSRSFKMLYSTIHAVFRHVRVFKEESGEEELTNIVFYASDQEIKIRKPTEEEMLGSKIRSYATSIFFDHEVKATFNDNIIYDKNHTNYKQMLIREDSYAHWKTMRSVFPIDLWLEY